MTSTDTLTPQQVEAEGLADWRFLFQALHARFRTGGFATGLRLVDGDRRRGRGDEPPPRPRPALPQVHVRLFSHDVFGVTSRDVDLARRISELAAELGVEADPRRLQVARDRARHAGRRGDQAVLGGGARLRDSPVRRRARSTRRRRCQPCGSRTPSRTSEPRQRFHLDIRVPPRGGRRSGWRPALAAGGTLVSDDAAPAFWVLADAQGNKACVTTWRAGTDAAGVAARAGPPSQMLGRVTDSGDGHETRRLPWSHAPGDSCTHATRELSPTDHSTRVTPRCPPAEGFFVGTEQAGVTRTR